MENLRHIPIESLEQTLTEWGEPKFRIQQIKDWIWVKNVGSIEEMTNISKELRDKLHELFFIPKVSIDHSQFSEDGTIKTRFTLTDERYVEGVLIPTEKRMTACVSSQVGCSLACKFCATGYLKRMRNMDWDEIVDEVTLLNDMAIEHYGKKLSNIVFMGMGEPLLNYKNVMQAIERITSPEGLGMSPKRITVSTAGVSKMIKKLGDDGVRFKLAVSLHAANDEKRNQIMPINETSDLKSLVEALNYFYQKTKSEITLEYILFSEFNDSQTDADELIKIFRQVPADLVNIIEYNPIEQADFKKPNEEVTDAFMAYLAKHRVNARLRHSRGKDIDAACGQLANIDTKK
ncbi:MAG TPA: 23S rRNA (adenine(2503)-C(2))-methyltransferase RlmN [Edaphocola sp.]|nr:23S rRNA (adenine(2503)-C(2))-methyltransferase RlmN [Edaphocola sp.]